MTANKHSPTCILYGRAAGIRQAAWLLYGSRL